MKGFDPKWVFYLGIAVTIETAIGQGSVSLTNVVPPSIAPYIIGWSSLLAFIGTAIMTALSGYSSAASGPLTSSSLPPPQQSTTAAMPTVPPAAKLAILLAVLVLGTLAFSASSSAQSRPGLHTPTGNVVRDIGDLNRSAEAKQTSDLATFLTKLAAIEDAISLSTSIDGLNDPVGNACWKQFGPLGALIKVHPTIFTGQAAVDIEAARLAAIGLNQVCANPNCGQMFVDATNTISAITKNPLNMSMQSLCAQVPVIGTSAVPTNVTPTGGVGTMPATPAKPQ